MQAFTDLIISFGVAAILFVIYAESGLLIGFLFPGDSLLFTAGFLVQSKILDININLFVLLLFIAAVLGESTGYLFGKKVGRKLFARKNTRVFRQENLLRAEKFYQKHGPITIVLACFVPIIRTFVPIVAGISKMNYRQFIPFNIIGALSWTASFTYLGYFVGKQLETWHLPIEAVAVAIILLSISPMIIHVLRDKERLSNIVVATKREINIILGREKR